MSDLNASTEGAAPASSEPVQQAPAIEPPPPVDNAHVAEGCEQFSNEAAPAHAALGPLAKIEELAMKWGGDVATEIRHLLAEARGLL